MLLGKGVVEGPEFVDRERELAELMRIFSRVKRGTGATVFLEGEAGVGKTAIFEEFAKRVGNLNARILRGRCLYKTDTEPYQPFIEALEPKNTGPVLKETLPIGLIGLGGDEEDGGEPADIPLGLIHSMEPDPRILNTDDVEMERDKMFNRVRSTLSKMSHSKPVILFLDDLQWADKASLQLLHYVTRNVRHMMVMVVCAYRPEELGVSDEEEDALLETIRRMGEENLSSVVHVDRMGKGSISKIVHGMIEAEDIPDRFIQKVYTESEGNPYFVIEVIKSLTEEGVIDPHAHVWTPSRDIDRLTLPGSLVDIVSRRIAKLDYRSKKILMYASVIGNHFDFSILQKAMGMDEEELLDRLDHLIEMHLIIEELDMDGEVFRFDHMQIRQVIYDGLSRSRARVMHKKIGELIEDKYRSRIPEVVYSLASHFRTGQVWDKGYKYSLLAGESAQALFAYDEAEEYFLQAAECLDRWGLDNFTGGRERGLQEKALLYLRLGELAYGSGRFQDAVEYHSQALRISLEIGEKGLEAEASCRMGIAKSQKGDYKNAEKDLDQALGIFQAEGQPLGMALANRGLGYCHWRAGELEDAIEHYTAAVESAKKAGDNHLLGTMYIDIGNVFNHRGDFENGLKYYNMAIEELENLNDYSEMARVYNNIGDLNMQMEQLDTAIEYLEKSVAASAKVQNVHMQYFALNNAAQALAQKGDLDRAETYANKALQMAEAHDDKLVMSGVYLTLGIIHRKRKNWSVSIDYFNRSILLMEILDIPFDRAQTQYHLGLTYFEMGEAEEAEEVLNTAKKTFEELGSKKELENVETLLATIREN